MFKSKWLVPAIGLVLVVIVGVLIILQEDDSTADTDTNTQQSSVNDDQVQPNDIIVDSQPQLISPVDYHAQFAGNTDDILLIDVRTPDEFASGHLSGAINIPVEELQARLNEVPDDKPIVVYCRSGNRSHTASLILDSAGYSSAIYDIDGGVIAWSAAGLPLE